MGRMGRMGHIGRMVMGRGDKGTMGRPRVLNALRTAPKAHPRTPYHALRRRRIIPAPRTTQPASLTFYDAAGKFCWLCALTFSHGIVLLISALDINLEAPMKVMGKFPANCPGECRVGYCPKRVQGASNRGAVP
jgi:hypothetical protein